MYGATGRLLHDVEKLQLVVIVIAASGVIMVRTVVGEGVARCLSLLFDLELGLILLVILIVIGGHGGVIGHLGTLGVLDRGGGSSALSLGLGSSLAGALHRSLGTGGVLSGRGHATHGTNLGELAGLHAMGLEDALESLGTGGVEPVSMNVIEIVIQGNECFRGDLRSSLGDDAAVGGDGLKVNLSTLATRFP